MRLEPVCRREMHYDPNAAWLRPFGKKEGAGFGYGEGTVKGPRLRGKGVWANHPRRREDGVWCPDCHGFTTTDDAVKILFTIQGYSIDESTPTVRRALEAAIWFHAQDERYRWLNYHMCIGEGEIDEDHRGVVVQCQRGREQGRGCFAEDRVGEAAVGVV